jgi:hypothetical protein
LPRDVRQILYEVGLLKKAKDDAQKTKVEAMNEQLKSDLIASGLIWDGIVKELSGLTPIDAIGNSPTWTWFLDLMNFFRARGITSHEKLNRTIKK